MVAPGVLAADTSARMVWLGRLLASGFTVLVLAGSSAVAAHAQTQAPGEHFAPVRGAGLNGAAHAATTPPPLQFGGGNPGVITTPTVYLSFWGPEWSAGFTTGGYTSAQAETYLQGFFTAAGGSGWENVVTEFCQGVAINATSCAGATVHAGNPVGEYADSWVDTATVPASPTNTDIANAAVRAERHFGYHPGAVYFVVTPTGKSQTGFGTSWCAYHGAAYDLARFAYAYLPYIPDAGYNCGVNSVYGRSDSFGHGYFDGFSIVGGHEYLEAITDPFPNTGWVDSNGDENADKCQWAGREGVYTFSNGQSYAVQPTWSNVAGGCMPALPGRDSAVSPGPAPIPTPTPTPSPIPTPTPATGYTGYFSWFDNASPGMTSDNIHIVNTGSGTVNGTVTVGGGSPLNFSFAGHEAFYTFPAGTMGGPVVVRADSPVIAAQRVQHYGSFNEVRAMTATDADQDLWLPWYDTASPGMAADNLHLVNPSSAPATGTISIGPPSAPIASATFSISAGWFAVAAFPGVIGGPVHIHADRPILASQRVTYGSTFNESLAQRSGAAGSDLFFNWYDLASPGMVNDNIHLVNPNGSAASGHVYLRATGASQPFSIAASDQTFVNFGHAIGGPVEVVVDSGSVLATQRVQYYDSFNESAGRAASAATGTSFMAWYDLASPGMTGDNVHLVNPGPAAVTGIISLLGRTTAFSIDPRSEWFSDLGVQIGGPITVTVTTPGGKVLASQRVEYGESFNEAPASS